MVRKTRTFKPEEDPDVRYDPDGTVYVEYGEPDDGDGEAEGEG